MRLHEFESRRGLHTWDIILTAKSRTVDAKDRGSNPLCPAKHGVGRPKPSESPRDQEARRSRGLFYVQANEKFLVDFTSWSDFEKEEISKNRAPMPQQFRASSWPWQ